MKSRVCSICQRKNTNAFARHETAQLCSNCYRDGWRIRPDGAIAHADDYNRGGYFRYTTFIPFTGGGGEGVRLNGQLYKVYFEDELPRNQRYEYHLILRRSWKRMFDSRAGQPVKEMIG